MIHVYIYDFQVFKFYPVSVTSHGSICNRTTNLPLNYFHLNGQQSLPLLFLLIAWIISHFTHKLFSA